MASQAEKESHVPKLSEEDLKEMPRQELQSLASEYGIFGNLTKEQLVEELSKIARGEKPTYTKEAARQAMEGGIPAPYGRKAADIIDKAREEGRVKE